MSRFIKLQDPGFPAFCPGGQKLEMATLCPTYIYTYTYIGAARAPTGRYAPTQVFPQQTLERRHFDQRGRHAALVTVRFAVASFARSGIVLGVWFLEFHR